MKQVEFSKNNAKYASSLHLKKYRDKFNKFIAEGDKICVEMLRSPKVEIEYCFASTEWINKYEKELSQRKIYLIPVKEKELKSISLLKTPNQVLMIAEKISFPKLLQSNHPGWMIYLDDLQDPGNMGTILRIADWFGWNGVCMSPRCVDVFSSKVVQASMGAFLRVPHFSLSLEQAIQELGWEAPIYGADMHGENVFQKQFAESGVLIIGNEGRGISKEVQKHIQEMISIPKGNNGGAESLNAAVATGILCSAISAR